MTRTSTCLTTKRPKSTTTSNRYPPNQPPPFRQRELRPNPQFEKRRQISHDLMHRHPYPLPQHRARPYQNSQLEQSAHSENQSTKKNASKTLSKRIKIDIPGSLTFATKKETVLVKNHTIQGQSKSPTVNVKIYPRL